MKEIKKMQVWPWIHLWFWLWKSAVCSKWIWETRVGISLHSVLSRSDISSCDRHIGWVTDISPYEQVWSFLNSSLNASMCAIGLPVQSDRVGGVTMSAQPERETFVPDRGVVEWRFLCLCPPPPVFRGEAVLWSHELCQFSALSFSSPDQLMADRWGWLGRGRSTPPYNVF